MPITPPRSGEGSPLIPPASTSANRPAANPAPLSLEVGQSRQRLLPGAGQGGTVARNLQRAGLEIEQRVERPIDKFHVDEHGKITLNGLPEDISTLFRLAETIEFTLPPSLHSLAKAHGFEGVKFPCQVGTQLVAKLATAEELQKRLAEFHHIDPSFNGGGKLLTGVQIFMAVCLVKNILLAAYALNKSSFQPQVSEGLGIVSEIVAGFVHAKVYQDISSIRNSHREVSDIRGILPINIPEGGSLDNLVLAKAVQEKLKFLTDDMVSDIPKLLVAFLTLLVGNYILAQAAVQERP